MINMMYLVLTALLALNVSKEILDSFVTVNTGLETTKLTLGAKMSETYATFSSLASENPKKYGGAFASAQQVQQQAQEMVAYIDQIKARVISETEKLPMEQVIASNAAGVDTVLSLENAKGKDNYTVMTNLMGMGEPAKPKEGEFTARELRTKLEAFREQLKTVAAANPVLVANLDRMFNFDDRRDASGTMSNWESINFYHVPLAAGVTILSKIQMDIRNAENELVNWMLEGVEGQSLKFSTLAPVVVPVSNYVTVGDSFRADVYLAAYDPLNPPTVELSRAGTVDTVKREVVGEKDIVPIGLDGKGKLRLPAQGVGNKNWKGVIKFKPVGGEEQRFVFEANYEVAQPNLVVSPTKMNVFYRGVDNPVDISVPGFSADKITPSINSGTITKATGGGYIVKPGQGNEAVVSVSVTMPDGSRKSMPGLPFRVRTVPDPVPYFANKSFRDDKVSKTDLSAAMGVIAKMENFDFDLRFEVTEFTIGTTVSGNYRELTSKSNRVTGEMQEMLRNAKPNQRFFIERIKVKGPDGTQRTLPPISLKVT